MAMIHIRNLADKIIHSVQVDQPRQLFPADLRGLNLSNADLSGASLPGALLDGAVLIGARLVDADLRRASLRGCDLRYSDLSGCDLTGADMSDVDVYPSNLSKKTKLWDARIDPGSELAAMSQAITKARLRRSDDVEEFDVWQAERATTSLLDPNTKRLEKKIAKERQGWSNSILKTKMRILRYSREIELNKARREKDLIFLSRQGVDLSFASEHEVSE
jgi:uncharacterized protein YjbI with pentapeptide repeats